MSDLVFEDPPRKSRRSEHWDYLLALKEHPATETFTGWARYRGTEVMTEKLATGLATSLRSAASKLGEGWEVTARMVPQGTTYGVWVRYVPTAGDEPTIQTPIDNTAGVSRYFQDRYGEQPPPESGYATGGFVASLPDEPEFHDDNGERDAPPMPSDTNRLPNGFGPTQIIPVGPEHAGRPDQMDVADRPDPGAWLDEYAGS